MSESATILIVDDETSIRRSLVNFLEDYEYTVVSAGSAEEALEIMEHSEFDLAVVDLRLPGISGEAMIIKAHEKFPRMGFVIHTGSVNYRISESLIKMGMSEQHIYHKPTSGSRFTESVKRC